MAKETFRRLPNASASQDRLDNHLSLQSRLMTSIIGEEILKDVEPTTIPLNVHPVNTNLSAFLNILESPSTNPPHPQGPSANDAQHFITPDTYEYWLHYDFGLETTDDEEAMDDEAEPEDHPQIASPPETCSEVVIHAPSSDGLRSPLFNNYTHLFITPETYPLWVNYDFGLRTDDETEEDDEEQKTVEVAEGSNKRRRKTAPCQRKRSCSAAREREAAALDSKA